MNKFNKLFHEIIFENSETNIEEYFKMFDNGKIPWERMDSSRLYVEYVRQQTGKDPMEKEYFVGQYFEDRDSDMPNRLYIVDEIFQKGTDIVLKPILLKQNVNGSWVPTKPSDDLAEHYFDVQPDFDDAENYCLTRYERAQQHQQKRLLDKSYYFYSIDNIDEWLKENNVKLS